MELEFEIPFHSMACLMDFTISYASFPSLTKEKKRKESHERKEEKRKENKIFFCVPELERSGRKMNHFVLSFQILPNRKERRESDPPISLHFLPLSSFNETREHQFLLFSSHFHPFIFLSLLKLNSGTGC